MDNTFWTPDEKKDKKAKQYLDKINHSPYLTITLIVLSLFLVFTGLILMGSF
jgi:Fe2+ transport system protein B